MCKSDYLLNHLPPSGADLERPLPFSYAHGRCPGRTRLGRTASLLLSRCLNSSACVMKVTVCTRGPSSLDDSSAEHCR